MQNTNHKLHQRTQNPKEKGIKSEENQLKFENRPREINTIAPMSTEMKEVLAGLARFDLLPENSAKSEELTLPVINKKHIGSHKSQQVSMREKCFPNNNNTHATPRSRNVESVSRFSGINDIHLSAKSPKLAKPRILIDEIDNIGSKSKEGSFEPPQRSGRFRSVTYPYKSNVDEPENNELFSKTQLHLLSREKIRTSSEESGFNEFKLDGPRRPRASTFPYYHELSTSELDHNFSSATLRDQHNLISREASSSSSDSSKQLYRVSKPTGKTTSQDEMTTAIVNRCEEWFQWREGRRKLDKYHR